MACVRRKWQDMPKPSSGGQLTLFSALGEKEPRRPGGKCPDECQCPDWMELSPQGVHVVPRGWKGAKR